MYKPPKNTNRVKDMRNKFEKNDLNSASVKGPKLNNKSYSYRSANNEKEKFEINGLRRENTSTELRPSQQILSRQLSDPLNKRNVKRTPAFRLDKNTITQKSYRSTYLENKIKIFDKRLNEICDNDENVNINIANSRNKSNKIILNNLEDSSKITSTIKEKIELDKELNIEEEQIKNIEAHYANIKFLYAEPVPKALRNKQIDNIHDQCTLKLLHATSPNDNVPTENSVEVKRLNFIKSSLHSKALDLDDSELHSVGLTDTLKSALKRPLPAGPAPRKPPRTFLHSPQNRTPENEEISLEKTISQLNLNETFTKELNSNLKKCLNDKSRKKTRGKSDPKYMLDKLENALKNNKIRLKKQPKQDTTSGEESETDIKNGANSYSQIHSSSPSPNQIFNLNCLSSFGCTNSVYEKIKEPSSSFFINKEEPVYAIPFQNPEDVKDFPDEQAGNSSNSDNEKCMKRNSLYYMSSPVLSMSLSGLNHQIENVNDQNVNSENLVISKVSSNMDRKEKPIPAKNIKEIINAFEEKSTTTTKSKSPEKHDDRVKVLENQLRTAIDNFSKGEISNIGSSSSTDQSEVSSIGEDAFSASKDDITKKFETYVKTVRVVSEPKKKYDAHLFTCCIVVGLCGKEPYIKSKYPSDVEIAQYTHHFCFPDVDVFPMDDSYKAQCYSLVITKDSGERTYGYCRRVLPEGSKNCLPIVYCILSKHRAAKFYRRVLEEIESRHGLPDKLTEMLINEFYNKPFPAPGGSIRVDISKTVRHEDDLFNGTEAFHAGKSCETKKDLDLNTFVVVSNKRGYGTINKVNKSPECSLKKSASTSLLDSCKVPMELVLTLHQDSRYGDTDLKELCTSLNIIMLQKVFASLLLERKVIFVSCILSKLSSCIEALQSILYPFSWPHTFVPVLPSTFWEIVETPTPIICGVLCVSVINNFKIENAFVVDLDEGAVLLEVGDESNILPSCLVRSWKEGLSLANSTPSQENAHNVLLSDAFLRVFVNSCGHYKNFIVDGVFQKEAFLEYPKGRGVRRFLKWFTETNMFHSFIDSVVTDLTNYPIFDNRIQIFTSQEAALILEKMKDWNKEKK